MEDSKCMADKAYDCLDVWDLNRLVLLLNRLVTEDRCQVPAPRSQHDVAVYQCAVEYPFLKEQPRNLIQKIADLYAA
jgi:hypothetical protein